MIDIIKLEAAMRELSSESLSSSGKFLTQRSESKELSGAIDPITYVYSREFFELQLGVQLNIAKRQSGLLVIFAIEIDNPSQRKDFSSADAINSAARKVAKCLSALFRRGTDFVARTASNQFMVLTLSMSKEQAEAYLPVIRSRLREIRMEEWPIRNKTSMSSFKPKAIERLCPQDLMESVNALLHADEA